MVKPRVVKTMLRRKTLAVRRRRDFLIGGAVVEEEVCAEDGIALGEVD
tara:strand:+ start:3616 stop:3759 length:144 start_codon:yes stop_codon:yes gene_type:complete